MLINVHTILVTRSPDGGVAPGLAGSPSGARGERRAVEPGASSLRASGKRQKRFVGEHWGRMAVCECYLQDKVLAAPLLRLYV